MRPRIVIVEKKNGVGWITLNRPKMGNALDLALSSALFDALSDCEADPEVRCIVLRGNGKLFCGGGDLSEFGSALADIPNAIKRLADNFHRSVLLIDEMEKPLITSINGPAAGAGLVLATLGDIALASDKASFTPAYLSIGLTPDGSSTWTLPRLMGVRRAMEFLLTGAKVGAHEATDLGLVTKVVPHDDLVAETEKTARLLANGASNAKGWTRHLVRSAASNTLAQHLEMEAASIARSAGTEFAQSAILAALDRSDS